ncbi:MAG: nucleotidyltransferase domain-containing protein [Magnetococcales bacterium]|nr:nucleotidyltransferase domain-containing protein [Magnetococcales bacterium]MBF0148732.1 nucleotidyltransferase domain-containing protein [Magnetococcales bacterium]MBF0348759.1 nucleotidyltransferase domain-containing protein [Magnetococcales bacterium]MBF0630281.1 nucleotidyltransferase domain-containing protein [Magnetococcales bacterium]
MVAPDIVRTIKNYLNRLEERGMPVAFGVLYGSFSRGDEHADSDVDLVVVSPRFDNPDSWSDTELLWETTVFTDSRIEPVGVGLKQWHEEDGIPLIEIARREGRIIQPY